VTRGDSVARYQLRTPSRVNGRAWGIGLGLLFGLGLLIATDILVLKGGRVVGPHLALLGSYLPGYRVSFGGSLLGFGYGMLIGYCAGRLMGAVYNRLVLRHYGVGEDDGSRAAGRRTNE
jgi:hypothetical protein